MGALTPRNPVDVLVLVLLGAAALVVGIILLVCLVLLGVGLFRFLAWKADTRKWRRTAKAGDVVIVKTEAGWALKKILWIDGQNVRVGGSTRGTEGWKRYENQSVLSKLFVYDVRMANILCKHKGL